MTHSGPRAKRSVADGFTLIEIMIVVALIAIITGIALPSYTSYIARAKRADARTQLLQAAQFMQRFYAANDSYSVDRANGAAIDAMPAALKRSPADGTQMYTLTVTYPTTNSFLLTMTPNTGTSMANDACGAFTLDAAGVKGVTNATKSRDDCWK